ncbi:MAG: UvrD-helicase domain-containing protein [Patescibacteria group bacterium]|nr:UvrD-helicase domain-containing protein [Patescibacteria group bacterium]
MKTSKFEELYGKLNPRQKEAVDAIEGPVMVIAGPGTGKTSILTLRIANILAKTDASPDSILALTFTESGVYSMRTKLADIIGSAAYKVNINTFHGFANEIIKNYPEEFPRIIGSNNATDIDQIKILEEIINSSKLQKLKPYGDSFHYVRPIISEIRNLKRENVSPEKLAEIIKEQEKDFSGIEDLHHKNGKYFGEMKGKYKDIEKSIEKNKELLIVYEKYEKSLMGKRLYDYEDMILETIKSLTRDKGLLLELQEKYQYLWLTNIKTRIAPRIKCWSLFPVSTKTRTCSSSGTKSRRYFVSKARLWIIFFTLKTFILRRRLFGWMKTIAQPRLYLTPRAVLSRKMRSKMKA